MFILMLLPSAGLKNGTAPVSTLSRIESTFSRSLGVPYRTVYKYVYGEHFRNSNLEVR